MSLSLPKNKSKPSESLSDFSMLLYGLPKIGKTSFCAEFPDAFFMMCEPGGKNLSIYQAAISNWQTFLKYITLLETEERFANIVVDTVELCARMCQRYVCKKFSFEHPSDEEYGKGWDKVREELSLALQRLCSTGRGVIFIAHEAEKTIKRSSGIDSTRILPRLAGSPLSVIEPMVDIYAYYAYNSDDERVMYVRGTDLIAAGHRLQRNFTGVDEIPMGNSSVESYRNFMDAFNKKPPKKGELPTKRRFKKKG